MIINTLPNLDTAVRTPSIATNIRTAREDCGLTQKELGRLIGYDSPTALSFIESGQRNVTALKLWDIAHVTNKPIEWFYS